MDLSAIISAVFLIGFLLLIGTYAIKYWPLTLFITGVVLINLFTVWAAALIFALAFGIQIYENNSKNELTSNLLFNKILPSSFETTFYVVIASLIIGFIFSNIGGGHGTCSRSSPQFC